MSDLQCPMTALLVPRERLASPACERAWSDQRLAGFYVDAALVEAPELAAIRGRLQTPLEPIGPFADADSFIEAVDELADIYRGETIAVVATAALIQAALHRAHPPTEAITVAIDRSGWAVRGQST